MIVMVKKYVELLFLISFCSGLLMFFVCFYFFLTNIRDFPIPNIGLQSFLIALMAFGALIAIGMIILYYLYFEKKWYGK